MYNHIIPIVGRFNDMSCIIVQDNNLSKVRVLPMFHFPLPASARHRWAGPLLLFLFALSGCSTAPPAGMDPVTPFDLTRYEGKWYELARLDHSFERGLSDVSATYRAQPDGSIEVVNRGYDSERKGWQEATGKALFVDDPNRGSLKVSFFGPFYGGYHVVALDQQNYRWAMVVGPNRDYLWILARDKRIAANVRDRLLSQARRLGLEVDKLIWVDQARQDG